ncbi:MAG TPA: CvpA family protein [Paracoccaceae bacterium]|nr:CvpA family protein [Paracoccaceae bacterium]
MEFNIVDGVVLAVLALSGVLAFSRGFTRETLAILGWVAAAFAALYAAPLIEPLLKEIPAVGPMLAASCSLGKLAAFSVGFAVALVLISIFTPLFAGAVQNSLLGPIDRAAGFLFGVARGVVLVAVVYLVYDLLVAPADRLPMIEEARSVAMISDAAAMIEAALPETAPAWLMQPINGLMAECGGVDLGGFGAPETGEASTGEASTGEAPAATGER